ncbi:MAG: triose-phosphate isomerase [Ichthyobacteriaceae bacterium]|nr:triose-phosphate isomerase [Ichthyobacteriaceae bacterium]
MRRKIVAGNWKLNLDINQGLELVKELAKEVAEKNPVAEVVVTPSFVNLAGIVAELKDSKIEVAAQNVNENKNGAFTGEVAANMLTAIGVEKVILGHSERRAIYGEDDALLAKKVDAAFENNMEVIFCIGEQLEERKENRHFDVVSEQIEKGLFHLEAKAFDKIVLAYEPVWAIGTGETASPEQAQEMHAHIRKVIDTKYGVEVASKLPILYGGSVKPANAKEIFSKEDVDGGLIGGAALKVEDFMGIVTAFN